MKHMPTEQQQQRTVDETSTLAYHSSLHLVHKHVVHF